MIRLVGALTYHSSMISLCGGRFWFHCAHESAHELAFNLRGDGIHINTFTSQKCSCVLNVVNSGRLNIDGFKSYLCKPFDILRISEGTRNTANPQEHVAPYDSGHFAARDYIGHSEAAARLQHPECLA